MLVDRSCNANLVFVTGFEGAWAGLAAVMESTAIALVTNCREIYVGLAFDIEIAGRAMTIGLDDPRIGAGCRIEACSSAGLFAVSAASDRS